MSLQQQLNDFKSQMVANTPDEIVSVMVAASQDLADSGIVDSAPKVGQKLAGFDLPNQSGQPRRLESLLGDGPVVVTFYRGGWCPYCNLELKAYQQHLAQIKAQGATLVAISPELPDASLSTTEKNELEFEVLTDKGSAYARQLGLVFTLPEALRPIYESFGIMVQQHNGAGQYDLPLAATFVVGTDGAIAYAKVDADYTVRAEPSEIVSALQQLSANV